MRVARLDEADVFGDDWLASRRGHDSHAEVTDAHKFCNLNMYRACASGDFDCPVGCRDVSFARSPG